METTVRRLEWPQPGWRLAARAWVDEVLASAGISRRGPIRLLHVRPWSRIARVPTDVGPLYFKATVPSLANEPAISAHVAGRFPDIVVRPLAVDAERRWMLLPGGGRRLRSAGSPRRRLTAWERLLPRYAELQLSLLGAVDLLLSLGALDRRPAELPAQVDAFISDPRATRVGRADGLTPAEVAELRARLPEIERLASAAHDGIGLSLQHDDLHDGNVFASGTVLRIFDWGDSAVSHPLATLNVTLASAARRAELARDAPELRRLRDAYLEPWMARFARRELDHALQAIERIYPLMRALSWDAAFAALPPDEPHELRSQAREWWREYLRRIP